MPNKEPEDIAYSEVQRTDLQSKSDTMRSERTSLSYISYMPLL